MIPIPQEVKDLEQRGEGDPHALVTAEIARLRESGVSVPGIAAVAKFANDVILKHRADPLVAALIANEIAEISGVKASKLKLSKGFARVSRAANDVTPGFDRSETGSPLMNLSNAVSALAEQGQEIWFDQFKGQILTSKDGRTREWTDDDTRETTLTMQRELKLSRMPTQIVHEAVQAHAARNSRDVVLEWLNSRIWDRTRRLANLMHLAFGAVDNEYTRAVSVNLVRSIVARALQPGCKADCMVVLEGPQGTRKSTALAMLPPDREFFGEASESPHSKDFFMALAGKLVVEIGELDSFNRADVAAVKRVLSCQVDRYRPPYGRTTQSFPRRGVFCATTNSDRWLKDQTGGRRFWPIKCGTIDLAFIESNRDQLFAEAVHDVVIDHAAWWVMPEAATLAEQQERLEVDPWLEILENKLSEATQVTISEVFDQHLLIEPARRDKAAQMRVAAALKHLGFQRVDGWAEGRKLKFWKREGGARPNP